MAEATEAEVRDAALRKAYQSATKTLREKYHEEFAASYVAEAKKLGVDYTPRPTKAEKAEADLAALLKENPDLAERLAAEVRNKIAAESGAAAPGYATAPVSE